LNLNLQLALWWFETGNFGYERWQSNQALGAFTGLDAHELPNHYVPRNGRGIQQNLFGLVVDRYSGF
jgi:hypothetical protein